MKYNSNNKPLVCMQTQSTCYKGTSKMTPKGILWHSTGANNPTLKRYVQPSDTKPAADTYSKSKWLEILGKNQYNNDWNHIDRQAGLNCWIGKLADGTVTTVQTMPWDYKPWGCGSGSKGSLNNTHLQFEICEDSLTDKNYFNTVYQEACEITAYLCKMYNIDPKGTFTYNGVTVPTILCHYDSYKLGLGSNHGDVYNWFNKYGKTMDDVRNDVSALLKSGDDTVIIETTTSKIDITYQTWDDVKNKWLSNVTNDSDYAGVLGDDVCAVYANLASGDCVYKVHTLDNKKWLPEVKNREDYAGIFNQPIDAFMIKSTDPSIKIYYQVHTRDGKWLPYVAGYDTTDSTNGYAGIIGKPIDGIRMYAEKTTTKTIVVQTVKPQEEKKEEVEVQTYKLVTEVNRYSNVTNATKQVSPVGTYKAGTYYIYTKYPTGYNGMYNLTTDKTGAQAGSWINPAENVAPVTNTAKSYTVVTTINRYGTVTDAINKTNSKGTYTSGIYYIYEKYPDGSNGMFNISTDKTGKSAGSWINPTENVVKESTSVTPTPQPEEEKKQETTIKKEVYDLDYLEKHRIIDYDIVQTEGINKQECTRAILSIKKNNADFDIEIAKAFFFLADRYHIDPMRAISQSILETGWFKYQGSAVKPEHHNYCGLGVTSNGIEGGKFDTIENGVRAQLQHLYAYGCNDALPDGETTIVDPRFKYVTRGIATYWEQLAGRWCVPGYDGNDAEASMRAGTTYGQKIDKIYQGLISTKVTDEDIKKYFSVIDDDNKEEPKVEPVTPIEPSVEPVIPIEPEDNNDINMNWLTKLIKAIIDVLFGLFKGNK